MDDNNDIKDTKDIQDRLAGKIKIKRIRRWALIALAAIICVFAVSRLDFEAKDRERVLEGADVAAPVTVTSETTEPEARDGKKRDGGSVVTESAEEASGTGQGSMAAEGADGDRTSPGGTSAGSPASPPPLTPTQPEPGAPQAGTAPGAPSVPEEPAKPAEPTGPDVPGGGGVADLPAGGGFTVTLSIDCKSLSGDLSRLTDKSVEPYIPPDGVILARTTLDAESGTSAYDLLCGICRLRGIQMDASYTPMFDSYYVKGINFLYEKMAGLMSGWKYRVNGEEPNYGSSSYMVKAGDVIEWFYYCG